MGLYIVDIHGELEGDYEIIRKYEEPTTKNDLGVEHHKQNIQAYAHDFGVSEEQAEKELRVTTKNDLGVDCISRADLIERINNAEEQFKYDNMETIGSDDGDPFVDGVLSGVWNIREMVKQAPSVTPQPCEDAVSRQAVLDIAKASKSNWIDNSILFKRVNEIPSVTPQEPRAGHWIEHPHEWGDNWQYSDYECSICHNWAHFDTDFCPNCGAKMAESEGEE